MDAPDSASGDVRVGFAICDPAVSFGAIVGLGAKERAAELGADLSIVSVFTPEQQAPVIERFAAGHVDVLIVKALESEVVVPALREAAAAGIPVIVADGRIDGIDPACSVCFDNVKGAELAAAFLVERLQERGTIAHLQGPLTSVNGLRPLARLPQRRRQLLSDPDPRGELGVDARGRRGGDARAAPRTTR